MAPQKLFDEYYPIETDMNVANEFIFNLFK